MGQGHATFRPGAVRHAGNAVSGGVRYVIGGFIAVADRVEHVRRLNERGNRILLAEHDALGMLQAERLFRWGALLNPNCSLCYQNLGDVYLRLDQPADAEEALTQQLQLMPRDSDAYFALGNALRGQERPAEARAAFEAAVAITPSDAESWVGLAGTLGALGDAVGQEGAYRAALALRPADVSSWINLAVTLSPLEDREGDVEAAFRAALLADPSDARAPLNLGRYLAKLSRPAEAISQFYAAAVANVEYFEEVVHGHVRMGM